MLKELQVEECRWGLVGASDKFSAGTNCVQRRYKIFGHVE
jgi:hypothetical protein